MREIGTMDKRKLQRLLHLGGLRHPRLVGKGVQRLLHVHLVHEGDLSGLQPCLKDHHCVGKMFPADSMGKVDNLFVFLDFIHKGWYERLQAQENPDVWVQGLKVQH